MLLVLPLPVLLTPGTLPQAFRIPDKCKECNQMCDHDICCEAYCTLCKA